MASAPISRGRGVYVVVALRNLWRNKGRTILTSGAIAFAIMLVQVGMSFQVGSYGPMIDMATRLGSGHIQVQNDAYFDDRRIEYTVSGASQLLQTLRGRPGVLAATSRAEAFALVSNEERSYGALVIAVNPQEDQTVFDFASHIEEGTYLEGPMDAVLGSLLAKNLGLEVGDTVVVLGTDSTGGVAAMALDVGGIFSTGNSEVDRSMVQVPLENFQEAFGMADEVHRIILQTQDPMESEPIVAEISKETEPPLATYDWRTLMPEIAQAIEMDKAGNWVVYAVLICIVVLSISNTFVVIVFERMRELGTLRAVGMRLSEVVRMLLVEAMGLWVIGTLCGLLLTVAIVGPMSVYGIHIEAMEDLSREMHVPDTLYPGFSTAMFIVPPIAVGVGTLIAAVIPMIKLWNQRIVDALREDE